MSSLIELLRGKCWFPSCVHWPIINISNWQTLLLITTPVLSLYTTLWNAYTSYEMSNSFSPRKDPDVQAFEDLQINTQRSTASLFDWLLGSARLGWSFWRKKQMPLARYRNHDQFNDTLGQVPKPGVPPDRLCLPLRRLQPAGRWLEGRGARRSW